MKGSNMKEFFKKSFECAYYGFNESMQHIGDSMMYLLEVVVYSLICLTVPIWIIPYAIYKNMKERG